MSGGAGSEWTRPGNAGHDDTDSRVVVFQYSSVAVPDAVEAHVTVVHLVDIPPVYQFPSLSSVAW